MIKKLRQLNIGSLLWVVLFISITLFAFEPVKNYLANVDEYWFTLGMVFPLYLAVSAVIFTVGALTVTVLGRISKKASDVAMAILFPISMAIYIQGNLIPVTTGTLDGTAVDWSIVNIDMIFSDVLWGLALGVIALGVFLAIKKKDLFAKISKAFGTISVCMILLEAVTVVSLMTMNPGFNDKPYYDATDAGEFEFSSAQNIVMLLLDNYDSMYFEQALNDEVMADFEDFTYYPDTVSKYGHTDLSLPQILSGECYLNEQPFREYLKEAYGSSTFLSDLDAGGWKMGLYTDSPLPKCELLDKSVNLKNVNCAISSRKRFLTMIYQIAAYNVAPYHLKQCFWFYPEFTDLKLSPSDEYGLYSWENQRFYEGLDATGTIAETPMFKLFHLKGMHVVFETNEDVVDVGYDVGMEATREANRKIMTRLISKLKEMGAYDNSIIIILADHGDTFMLEGGETGLGSLMEIGCEYKQNPLLLIKGINEHHDFVVSDKQISYDDLLPAYGKLISGVIGEDVFDSKETSGRTRTFYKHDDSNGESGSEYLSAIKEFTIDAHAWETDKLVDTGREYSNHE